ncbi:MAG: tRNA pseudouridine(38-40) synthase TruA [Cytobacillus gottheilii]|uniref:tRNA pseudouridine(38-40) synthase TruA n=1 Tax=Cytobacillus gottheilii TaxID=859144 RepID=UPI003464A5DD
MKRMKCTVSYDGTSFAGYQVQPGKRTVQRVIEEALTKLHKGAEVKITASGRTDAGVHAKGQVFHFDTPLEIPEDRWTIALNALLPADVAVTRTEWTSDTFHARFDTSGKEYRYFVQRRAQRDPFQRNYASQYPYQLDVSAIRKAIPFLIGEFDFTSFCSAKTEVEDKVRRITSIDVKEDGDLLIFSFKGNGFLYNMVRILIGTLLAVGNGQLPADEIPAILEAKDRTRAGKTAPPQGLYLWKVFYENDGK